MRGRKPRGPTEGHPKPARRLGIINATLRLISDETRTVHQERHALRVRIRELGGKIDRRIRSAKKRKGKGFDLDAYLSSFPADSSFMKEYLELEKLVGADSLLSPRLRALEREAQRLHGEANRVRLDSLYRR